jgi:hypothetical protein
MMRVLPLARRCAQRLAAAGRIGGELRARELIQDVLVDTLGGVLHWVPTRKTLEAHVVDTMRWRTRDECAHAARHLSVELPTALDGEPSEDREWEGAEQERATPWGMEAEDRTSEGSEEQRRGDQVLRELRQLAQGDREVLQLLRAYEHGARSAADVLAMVSLTTAAYRNARMRLGRLVKRCKMTRQPSTHRKATTP